MSFKKMSIDDIAVIKPFFNQVSSKTCDFSIGGMFMWRKYYDMEYFIDNHILFSKLKDEQGNTYYNLPLSDDIENAIVETIEKWYKKDTGIKFFTIPEEYLSFFTKLCPHAKITEQTNHFDYLYNASDLIELSGRKYHVQRNQINQFICNNTNWKFVNINDVPIENIIDFFKKFRDTQTNVAEFATIENIMVLEVLQNMEKYQMLGGVLMVDDKICGFSLGEIINDTLFVHVEKADRTYKGAYQMLAHEFLKFFAKDVAFINREEDMGDLGLRRAKESYHPKALLKKYIVEVH